jgi:hypothetical protein
LVSFASVMWAKSRQPAYINTTLAGNIFTPEIYFHHAVIDYHHWGHPGLLKRVKLRLCCPSACHEGICWSGGVARFIIHLCTRWGWVVSFISWPLYSHGISACWIQDWVDPRACLGISGWERNILHLLGLKPQYLGQPACSLINRATTQLLIHILMNQSLNVGELNIAL